MAKAAQSMRSVRAATTLFVAAVTTRSCRIEFGMYPERPNAQTPKARVLTQCSVHTNQDLSDGYIDYGGEHRDFNEAGCEKDRWGNPVGDKESVKCHFPCDVPTPTTTIPPWTPTPVPDPEHLGKNPKVLIVGDSITHGHEGDFTWRYRISEWFREYAPDTKPTFVGYVYFLYLIFLFFDNALTK